MFKILSKDPAQSVGSLLLPSGEYTKNQEETYKHLLECHFPNSKLLTDTDNPPAPIPTEGVVNTDLIENIISTDRITWAVNSFAPYKSQGMDNIFPAMLKYSVNSIKQHLCILFKAYLRKKYIPKSWRGVKVVFITKPGKTDYSLAENFRPISLTSFMQKTLEKIVDRYLRDVLLKRVKIFYKQHAYQSGKSTENALHNIVKSIELALADGEYALGCFIDIAGAFNYITYIAIKRACFKHGIDPGIIGWIEAMLLNRIVYAHFGSSKLSVTTSKGCPQGGVLPPLLWCLVINELLIVLNENHFQTEGFSDDLATILRGKFVNVLCDLLQTVLNIVSAWCDNNELSVNPEKTKMILCTRKRKITGLYIPLIKGIPIKLVDLVKYLGITLDCRLKWQANLDSRITTATIALWQCRKAYSSKWGLSPKVMFWIYTTVIRPILTYGCFLWSHICVNKSIQAKLNKFQRMACSAITSAWKSTPTAALEALLNLPPLHIHIESTAISTLDRLARYAGEPYRETYHTKIWLDTINEFPALRMPSDKINTTFRFDKNFHISIPPREHWSNGILPPVHGLVIYTDGSLNDNAGAGASCDTLNIEKSIPLGTFPSILMAELSAIITICDSLLDRDVNEEIISICSDSQSILKILTSVTFKSAIALECYDKLTMLANLNRVNLIWSPGHSGIAGNVKADTLAKRGALMTPMGPEPIIGIPQSFITKIIRSHTVNKFNLYWNNLHTARQAKNCIRINKKHSKYLINLSRTRLKTYIGVMTGHYGFNKHLVNIGKRLDPGCDLCGNHTDTAEHFLCNCPAFISLRRKHLGGYIIRPDLIRSLLPQNILHYIYSSGRFEPTAIV